MLRSKVYFNDESIKHNVCNQTVKRLYLMSLKSEVEVICNGLLVFSPTGVWPLTTLFHHHKPGASPEQVLLPQLVRLSSLLRTVLFFHYLEIHLRTKSDITACTSSFPSTQMQKRQIQTTHQQCVANNVK